ncbi:putative Ig domain-containing protein [Hydrogenophaga sp.]|uniref:putative Ig domain-containing protein n=1 Tax=Hydrogenophaga sp. TaxID=1904254 RepID=UPI00271CAD2C|nr:putative Ig domain-containing protein [Hydrogenophaga sp.]MDO9436602.1 putative Ig domain-containing protein [Hydrogenophaga sp.]
MTRLPLSASIAQPTQRHRRLLLTLPACAIPMLSGCGGGDVGYDTEQALYTVGVPITPNKPNITGGNPRVPANAKALFSVSPALPAGLTLNVNNGVISGTPTKLKRQATHTVTARYVGGFTEEKLRITVTARGTWSAGTPNPFGGPQAAIAPLPNGKVLVAGWQTDGGLTDRVDIYDTATARWLPAARMWVPRLDAQCVPLRNGKVLVFAGALSSTGGGIPPEVYDPASNTWRATGPMASVRLSAASCLLPDGRVMVSGGVEPLNSDGSDAPPPLKTIELYDPNGDGNGSWSVLPKPMADPRVNHASVVLPGGKSVMLVGNNFVVSGLNRVELYPLDGGDSTLIPSPVTGSGTQALVLDDGSVLITTDAPSSWRFYPQTSTWTTSTHTEARYRSKMVLLADGRVLRAGGSNRNTAEIYNPDVNIWTPAASMAASRAVSASPILMANGQVLMIGGLNASTSASLSTELYTA